MNEKETRIAEAKEGVVTAAAWYRTVRENYCGGDNSFMLDAAWSKLDSAIGDLHKLEEEAES